MTNNSTHINYNFADIERYLQNKMSAPERHLLEKTALADLFLADAMEGYEQIDMSIAKQHLSSISQKLVPQQEEKEYTLDDIEKYLQGKMTAAEMHAIEKAALKDPFLADAMEGYEEMKASSTKNNLYVAPADSIATEEKQHLPSYNFNDIEQYLEGRMTPAESHAIEKTALKEPFLSDAIEGYEQSNLAVAKQHLTNIETAILGGEKEDTKVVAMNATNNNKLWLRIASAIIIIIGVGGTLWLANKKDVTPSSTAYVKEAEIKQTPSSTATIKADEAKTVTASKDNTPIKQPPISGNSQPTSEAASIVSSGSINADRDGVGEAPIPVPVPVPASNASLKENQWANADTKDKQQKFDDLLKNSSTPKLRLDSTATASATIANTKKEAAYFNAQNRAIQTNSKPLVRDAVGYDAGPGANDSKAKISNELRGSVINASGEPVPFAKVNLNRNARRFGTINSDAGGNFIYKSADTVLNADVAANGYAMQNATINANTMNTIVLQKDESLAETIVTENIGKKRKQTATAETTWGTPVGGLKSFEDYVSKKKEKLKKDSSDEEEYVEALVELEFDVDKLGKPYNISVTNSNTVDAAISNKAIQIVKEGPAWIADKKKKKAKVTIKL